MLALRLEMFVKEKGKFVAEVWVRNVALGFVISIVAWYAIQISTTTSKT
jgi:hypothetical protein